jgi:hypothetical protein
MILLMSHFRVVSSKAEQQSGAAELTRGERPTIILSHNTGILSHFQTWTFVPSY